MSAPGPAPPDGGPSPVAQPADGTDTRALFFRLFPSIVLPMFLAVSDQTIVAAALPNIAAELGDIERVSWIVVAYLVATTIAAPVYGRLGDAFGRRLMMYVALAVFTAASIGCALAPNVLALVAFRVLQGLGGGGLMTTSQALIGEIIPPRDRGRYQGYLATVVVTSNMASPVAGGFLTGLFGWRSIFFVNLPLTLLAAVLAARLPAASAPPARFRFDWPGLVLLAVFVVTTLLGVGQLRFLSRFPWAVVIAFAAVWLASLVLLIRMEDKAASPLIPVRLLAQPAIWRADAMAACHGAALVSMITYLPIYLSIVRGTTASETGLLLLPLTGAVGLGAMISGRLVSTTGITSLIPTVGLSVATILLVAMALAGPHVDTRTFVVLMTGTTFFMGSVMAVVQVTVQSSAPAGHLGSASASVQFSRSIGAAVGTALVGVVLFASIAAIDPNAAAMLATIVEQGAEKALGGMAAGARATLQHEIADAFRTAFLTIAAFTAAGIVLAWTNPMKRLS